MGATVGPMTKANASLIRSTYDALIDARQELGQMAVNDEEREAAEAALNKAEEAHAVAIGFELQQHPRERVLELSGLKEDDAVALCKRWGVGL